LQVDRGLRLTVEVVIRLLHTADWHLGATLHGWSREPEHRTALAQLIEIAGTRAVNALIVAGDIFDSLNPSAEAQRLLYETLRDLRAACPAAAIVLIAGNHDPAGRLEAPRALFEFAGVHSIGVVARQGGALDPRAHLVPVRDAAGALAGHILALPYPRAADLPVAGENVTGSPVVWGVRELYREAIAAARREIGDGPLILTGHLHVAGGLESEGAERRILIGGEHAAPPDIFPADVAYVALGHLHRPQKIGRETIRYSGSLLPMSKTEIDYPHGVTLVDIADDGDARVEHIPLARSVAHQRLPLRGAMAPEEIAGTLAEFCAALPPDAPLPFLYLALRVEGPATGLKAEIDAIVDKFPVRLASFSIERPRRESEPLAPTVRLADCAPRDLFASAFAHTHGVEPTPEHLRCFDQLTQDS
jgi:exonuclease SbcD